MKTEVVLVTGASGFLGQHIIKLLHERDESVTEIRAFDVKPFKNTLGYEEKKTVETIVGDVRNFDTLVKAFEGVNCVIHSAALIDVGAEPDVESMRQINVKGTENVAKACIECGVASLIYTSTVDVVVGAKDDIIYAREHQVNIPNRFLMGSYAETKYQGETTIIQADGTLLGIGGVLRTVVLRPVVMYGEGDPYFLTHTLRNTAQRRGTMIRLGDGKSFFQAVYVGNVAWAHIVAKNELRKHAEPIAGRTYFITDDTLPCNAFDFVEPFVVARGFAMSQKRYPYWAVWYFLSTLGFVHSVLSRFFKVPFKVIPVASVTYVCKTYVVNRMRATYRLRYSPLYTPDEAFVRSMDFYRSLPL